MKGMDFDLSTVTDSVVEAIRIRLPELISSEVKRQLAATPQRGPAISDTELRKRNALRARDGLPQLPGLGSPARLGVMSPDSELRGRLAALRTPKT